jgi:hypothetical protein
MTIRLLETSSQVIDELGGTTRVAERFRRSPQAISNWRSRGIPKTYSIVVGINSALKTKRCRAAESVWRSRSAA